MPTKLDVTDHSRDSAGLTYVYPVLSRRAGGLSIGINLNPNNACNWRCIYCQVPNLKRGPAPSIDLLQLARELEELLEMLRQGRFQPGGLSAPALRIVDVAFSGNGEPTSAREFPQAIETVARILRKLGLAGEVSIRLITNGSLMGRTKVQEGVRRLGELGGEVWFKVDAGTPDGYRRINNVDMSPRSVVRNLRRCAELCRTWVQTCLFAVDGIPPSESELAAYVEVLSLAGIERLAGVQLYGLARPSMQPEAPRLSPLQQDRVEAIAARLRDQGLTVQISP